MMTIGAQFWTVREFTKTKQGLEETLKKVADIGYDSVQLSGTCDYEPEWMAETLKKLGLTCPVTHFNKDKILENPEKVAREHAVYGCHNVGIGSLPMANFAERMTDEDYDKFVSDFKDIGKRMKAAGAYFMVHHHNREFARSKNGEIFMDRLLNDFPKDEMGIIMDTYWIQAGGGDVIYWIDKLTGRIPCVHLKDFGIDGIKPIMLPVGSGNLNMYSIVRACLDAGVRHLFVEQDDCNGEDPFDCLKKSYKYLKGLGL